MTVLSTSAPTGAAAPPLAAALSPTAQVRQRPLLGIALLVLSMWTLSGLDASGKWLMAAGLPLLVLSFFRYAVHLLLVLAVVLPLQGPLMLRSHCPREQLVRGLATLTSTLLFFTALRYLPQAEGSAINFLAPMLVLSVAPWVLKEPPRWSRWVAAVVAFIGVLVVIRPSGGLPLVGVVWGLLSACSMAVQYVANRRVAADDPLTSVIWSGAVGTFATGIAMPWVWDAAWPMLQAMTPWQWLLLVSTGITGALGHLLQIGAYRQVGASTLAPFVYLQIVSATTMGWLIWGHLPDALTWLGIAIICTSGACIGYLEWRRSRG